MSSLPGRLLATRSVPDGTHASSSLGSPELEGDFNNDQIILR